MVTIGPGARVLVQDVIERHCLFNCEPVCWRSVDEWSLKSNRLVRSTPILFVVVVPKGTLTANITASGILGASSPRGAYFFVMCKEILLETRSQWETKNNISFFTPNHSGRPDLTIKFGTAFATQLLLDAEKTERSGLAHRVRRVYLQEFMDPMDITNPIPVSMTMDVVLPAPMLCSTLSTLSVSRAVVCLHTVLPPELVERVIQRNIEWPFFFKQ